jgi:Bacterial protein of unknown function (DUF916)
MDMTPQRTVRIFLAALASLAAIAAAASPRGAIAAAPAAGEVLSVSPAHPDPSVATGRSYFVHSVAPGATWSDEVAIANPGSTTIHAWVDAVDGITSIRTGAVYSARAVHMTGAGAWVTPGVSSVTVAPHTQTLVPFTVSVPAGAFAGDHLAGISVESKQGSSSAGTLAITTMLRSVVAVQVRVPGPADFQLHVYGATLRAVSTTGTSGIALDMADAGELLGKPELAITLDGPAGYHRAQSLKLDTLLPGDRITDEILWPDALAPGDYRLSVTEDGSGRHGVPFVTGAHLASALRPWAPGRVPAVVLPLPGPTVPAWVLVASLTGGSGLAVLVVLMVAGARQRRCLHCRRSHRRGRLIAVSELDQMGCCVSCAVAVHNVGAGLLCHECMRSHVHSAFAH